MTDIVAVPASAAVIYPHIAEIYDVVLTEDVTALQAGYQLTTGLYGLADANVAGKQQARGIFLKTGKAGAAVPFLIRGHVAGYTVSGLNADVRLYLSDTVGLLADAAGTMSVTLGRVVAMPNPPEFTKVVYIDAGWHTTQWS